MQSLGVKMLVSKSETVLNDKSRNIPNCKGFSYWCWEMNGNNTLP